MECIETINILNIENEESTISSQQLITNELLINDEEYILSDADEELLILIQFKKEIELKSIKIYCKQNSIEKINDNNDNDIDISPPKDIYIYKILDLNINFDDLLSIQYDKSIKCNIKKLEKGQKINVQKTSKNSIKFKKIKYLAICIKTNLNNHENTIINAIKLNVNVENDNNNNNQIISDLLNNKLSQSKEEEIEYFPPIYKCIHINKIIDIIIYYNKLNIYNISDQQKLLKYINNKSESILNNFIHLMLYHNCEIETISNIINKKNKCNLINCNQLFVILNTQTYYILK